MQKQRICGVLLAAGAGRRFDPQGGRNKLLQTLPSGETVVGTSAANLRAAFADVIAVVRPGADEVRAVLQTLNCRSIVCPDADSGMAASLVFALAATSDAKGWVIALGDMPYVPPGIMLALAQHIERGALIAVPTYRSRRGNPVAFSRALLPELLALRGDQGARHLLQKYPVVEVVAEGDGILRDIDTPEDLQD